MLQGTHLCAFCTKLSSGSGRSSVRSKQYEWLSTNFMSKLDTVASKQDSWIEAPNTRQFNLSSEQLIFLGCSGHSIRYLIILSNHLYYATTVQNTHNYQALLVTNSTIHNQNLSAYIPAVSTKTWQ